MYAGIKVVVGSVGDKPVWFKSGGINDRGHGGGGWRVEVGKYV